MRMGNGDPINDAADAGGEVVDDSVDETAQAIREIRADISSMRVDIAAMREGGSHSDGQATGDVATGHENPDNEEDEDPPVFKTSPKKTRDSWDHYAFERRPVRKHGLFKRLFG